MTGIAPVTAKAMAQHWDARADSFQRAPSHLRLHGAWARVFASAIGKGTGRAIDLGCGTGACALALAELGYDVTAFDGSAGMLAHARRDAAERNLDIAFLQADMDNLPPEASAAEVVSIRNVLWTLERPERAIQLARNLLKPGGRLFVSDGIWRIGENSSETEFGQRLPNFNGVAEVEVRSWLADAGFSSVRTWQHLFGEHPYGAKYDAVESSDLIEFFVLTAVA